jgi:hypothetical protein
MRPFPPVRVRPAGTRHIRAEADEGVQMSALLQALAIGFVAAVLFMGVEKFQPNRLCAYLFMFLIIAAGTLAILDLLVP